MANVWTKITAFFRNVKTAVVIAGISLAIAGLVIAVFFLRANSRSQGTSGPLSDAAANADTADDLDKRSGELDKQSAAAAASGRSLDQRVTDLAARRSALLQQTGNPE